MSTHSTEDIVNVVDDINELLGQDVLSWTKDGAITIEENAIVSFRCLLELAKARHEKRIA